MPPAHRLMPITVDNRRSHSKLMLPGTDFGVGKFSALQ
jgi:hypothetical protein